MRERSVGRLSGAPGGVWRENYIEELKNITFSIKFLHVGGFKNKEPFWSFLELCPSARSELRDATPCMGPCLLSDLQAMVNTSTSGTFQ